MARHNLFSPIFRLAFFFLRTKSKYEVLENFRIGILLKKKREKVCLREAEMARVCAREKEREIEFEISLKFAKIDPFFTITPCDRSHDIWQSQVDANVCTYENICYCLLHFLSGLPIPFSGDLAFSRCDVTMH